MKKTKLLRKALVMICVMALVACLSVAATIAYFTDSEAVTNTFTVGKVVISMDELDTDNDDNTEDNVEYKTVNEQGETVTTVRDTANKYHLIPGVTYVKDPTIYVGEGSEDCWLFVKVENGIAPIETKDAGKSIADQMSAKGWTKVENTENFYAYKQIVGHSADKESKAVVFESFTIDGSTVDNTKIDAYKDANIKVTAYAIQAAGFDTSAAAWLALKQQNNL